MVWPHPRDVILSPDQLTIMIIYLLYALFLTFFLILKPVWSLIWQKCGNVGFNVTFLDIMSSCFQSLVPCLKFTLCYVAAKTGNRR